MSNPFSLETDNKKFFTGLSSSNGDGVYDTEVTKQYENRIRNMNKQLEQLARKRQQMLFKQSQMDYIFKRQKPSVGLGDFVTAVPKGGDKKFRVRSLLKEKKESLHDFLQKKKEIYLSKMNINIKKQETSKLADSIRDEQETLKARRLYFENDVQFMHKFIDGIKKQAEQAQNAVQAQLKQQQMLVSKLNGIQADIQKIDNLISKDKEILESLEKYKNFIENLYNQKGNPSWKHYIPKANQEVMLFMTQGGANLPSGVDNSGEVKFTIKYEPNNMIQIFANSQQANIREIQKLQDKEDELQNVKYTQRIQQSELAQVIKQNQQKISLLQKTCSRKLQECQKLREMKKSNNNKLNVLDNENLDIQKVKSKIFNIYQQVNPKRAQQIQQSNSQAQIKKQMTQIEGDIQKLRQQIKQQKQQYPKLINEVDNQFKEKLKTQNIKRNQQQNRRLQQKKQQQQQKKRSQAQNEKPKGRKIMQKVILNKKAKVEKKVAVVKMDVDEQYLKEQQ